MKDKNFTWVIKNGKGEIINRTSCETGNEVVSAYYGKLEEVIKLIIFVYKINIL